MNKSIKITIIIIGLLTLAASLHSFIKETQDQISYFSIFIGIALIGTALVTKSVKDQE